MLPLRITEGLEGTAEPRTWLLPLLRKYVRHARLAFWHKVRRRLAGRRSGREGTEDAAGMRKEMHVRCPKCQCPPVLCDAQELLPLAVALGARAAALSAAGGAASASLAVKCRALELQVG